MMWPPTFAQLKKDLEIPDEDDTDDDKLTIRLDASVSFVQRVRRDLFETDEEGELVEPVVFTSHGEREAASIFLGTILLARRLMARIRSDDMILWMAETGTTRLPFKDPEIERMLRIGTHELPRVG